MANDILNEVWRNRDAFAKQHHYDLDAMVAALQQVRVPAVKAHPPRTTRAKAVPRPNRVHGRQVRRVTAGSATPAR